MREPIFAPREVERSAIIDPTGAYRYLLRRRWRSTGDTLLFIMLNPSTADGEHDDATIRRCISFGRRWGFGSLEVVNLFAYRSTRPLYVEEWSSQGGDVVGPQNDSYITAAAERAARIVAAWGSQKWARSRAAWVLDTLLKGRPVYCLGITLSGDPKHPVRLARSARCEILHWDRSTSQS